jgi:general stress protein 26
LVLKAGVIMRNAEVAYIAKIDDKGYPRVSTISSIKTDGLKKVWFSTGLRSSKVKFFKQNNRASVCYHQGGNNITLIGDIEILTTPELKEQLWKDWFINHFPGGIADPNYCILEFTVREAVLWIDNQYEEIRL